MPPTQARTGGTSAGGETLHNSASCYLVKERESASFKSDEQQS